MLKIKLWKEFTSNKTPRVTCNLWIIIASTLTWSYSIEYLLQVHHTSSLRHYTQFRCFDSWIFTGLENNIGLLPSRRLPPWSPPYAQLDESSKFVTTNFPDFQKVCFWKNSFPAIHVKGQLWIYGNVYPFGIRIPYVFTNHLRLLENILKSLNRS